MSQFKVPANGVWTWSESVDVIPPGTSEPQSLTLTFRTVEDLPDLLNRNVSGALSNAEVVRALATDWDAAYEDGAPIPLDSDEAVPLLQQPWIAQPILKAYMASAGGQAAKNALTSGVPSPAPTTVPAPNRAERRAKASKKT
ncbi:hypothetical protein F1188_04370 [Roseospira marina]|uniref:Uncharacterized protein n=1 Tax=Roseospira marina TaxID=140057 RepID=A0A5M6IG57_9PROT|nr:hypothetical protein [Roseospira marina]KAA5607142.1 hypothetical protein F1188_04370 [Roseospira marina]MBB4312658.1 hypothetical protein [Roseospira marina]MBB5086569.1 hypothetical protein [Roseospira marina]